MKIILLALAASAIGLSGCETVKNYNQLAQPTGKEIETYVGGSIFKINRSKDLPNAFGKADLFGGKVYAGYTELRYQGITDDARLILRITETETHSTETTMSRYGESSADFSGKSDANGNISGSVTMNQPPQGNTEVLPPNTTVITFDPSKEKELVIAGVRVTFLQFTPQKLRYKLQGAQ